MVWPSLGNEDGNHLNTSVVQGGVDMAHIVLIQQKERKGAEVVPMMQGDAHV